MTVCRVCASARLQDTLDLGPQAITNRFLTRSDDSAPTFPATLAICADCAVVQMPSPPPVNEIRSRFPWITYNEPEGHLDRLVDRLSTLPGLTANSTIAGVTFKDDSTLDRFRKKGFSRTWRMDTRTDLGMTDPCTGIETIQARLTVDVAARVAAQKGKADLLLVRHILEHVHDLGRFVAALKTLLTPTGILVFEVPDCDRSLRVRDYSMFWEEHVVYFTPGTYRSTLRRLGFDPVFFESFPYPLENSMVAALRPASAPAESPSTPPEALEQFQSYSGGLSQARVETRKALEKVRSRGGRCAVMGAGHVSGTFINVMKVEDVIEFIVDDNPNKKGLFMPGSGLSIRGSEQLLAEKITLCLLGVSPESEARVLKANQRFVDQGGVFASIFPGTERALLAL